MSSEFAEKFFALVFVKTGKIWVGVTVVFVNKDDISAEASVVFS